MKKLIVLTMLFVLFIFSSISAKICQCGSFEKGKYSYEVNEGKGCCSGSPSFGLFTTYAQDEKGSWEMLGSEKIEASKAQNQCCPIS